MYFIIYNSYAVADFNEDDLKLMLMQYREKNKEHAVTGMLLWLGGQFLQLIEGEMPEIKQLYRNIEQDKRHKNIIILKEGNINVRFFADWTMGYKAVLPAELETGDGFKVLDWPNTISKSAALKLFKIIAANT